MPTAYGPVCPQPIDPRDPARPRRAAGRGLPDAQHLGVVGRQPGDGKPVMVWVHGGAYIFGSAASRSTTAAVLAGSGDVVVVTVNYRLGAFGFLDLSSFDGTARRFDSNVGMRDVLFALQWVRDNIAAFGGDPIASRCSASRPARDRHHTAHQPGRRGAVSGGDRPELAGDIGLRHRPRAQRVAKMVLDQLGMAESEVDRLPRCPTRR